MVDNRLDAPTPGYFKVRHSRGGYWEPAEIYTLCACSIHGGEFDMHRWRPTCDRYPDPHDARFAEIAGRPVPVERVWLSGTAIEPWEFRYLSDLVEHYRRHDPEQLDAKTESEFQAVDKMEPIW